MNAQKFPDWCPQIEKGSKLLVVGASGGMGRALIDLLLAGPESCIGAHRVFGEPVSVDSHTSHQILDLQGPLKNEKDCIDLVNNFAEQAKGVNLLVVLCGGISRSAHWKDLTESEWNDDINLNLSIPFFLSRAAMDLMGDSGGKVVLIGTESALHGGSPTSLPYGVAKRGIECLVQGLAREGAKKGILVNGVRAGFIKTGFHSRWQDKTEEDIMNRIRLIPLGRGGEPEEAAALIIYLLSGWSQFITGQMFAITGGDWL